MSDEEIALRLTEAWTNQLGLPASINEVVSNYKYILQEISKESE